jgi:hypothetical protein
MTELIQTSFDVTYENTYAKVIWYIDIGSSRILESCVEFDSYDKTHFHKIVEKAESEINFDKIIDDSIESLIYMFKETFEDDICDEDVKLIKLDDSILLKAEREPMEDPYQFVCISIKIHRSLLEKGLYSKVSNFKFNSKIYDNNRAIDCTYLEYEGKQYLFKKGSEYD